MGYGLRSAVLALAGLLLCGAGIPKSMTRLSHVDDSAEGQRALGASGHAVTFERPQNATFVEAVEIHASRYGHPQAPKEDFHVTILDGKRQPIADVRFPYATIERGEPKWYTLRTPSIEVSEQFLVAVSFNCGQAKGVRVSYDEGVEESHSLTGLAEAGFERITEPYDWMIRVVLSEKPTGKKGIVRLADRKPAATAAPFKDCIEIKVDTGKPDGKRSIAGAGPAIRIKPSEFLPKADKPQILKLHGLSVYASRYGSGYDLDKTTVGVTVTGPDGKARWEGEFPYGRFGYKPRWVNLALDQPAELGELPKGEITVSLSPRAARTKGIFFHYNEDPETSHSLIGTRPEPGLEWMIRLHVTAEPAPEF